MDADNTLGLEPTPTPEEDGIDLNLMSGFAVGLCLTVISLFWPSWCPAKLARRSLLIYLSRRRGHAAMLPRRSSAAASFTILLVLRQGFPRF